MPDQEMPSSESVLRIQYICTMPPPEGGVRVLVRVLAQSLERDPRVDLRLFDLTVRQTPAARTLTYLRLLLQIFREMKKCDAILFAAPSMTYAFTMGILVYFMARYWDKPIAFRHFGGDNAKFMSSRRIARFIASRTFLNADLLFFETKYDVEYFLGIGLAPVAWFSNNRPAPTVRKENFERRALRFVYLGWVMEEKGIKVLIDSVSNIDADLKVDLFGNDRMDVLSLLPANGIISYRGPIENSRVYEVLAEYDALILPTYWSGEGYPGVIIEAFLVGLPVIATRLAGIEEIVLDGVTGVLVEPRNESQLRQAIIRLHEDETTYGKLVSGVRKHASGFSSEHWHERFLEEIKKMCNFEPDR